MNPSSLPRNLPCGIANIPSPVRPVGAEPLPSPRPALLSFGMDISLYCSFATQAACESFVQKSRGLVVPFNSATTMSDFRLQ